jgi:hypothetical protein
VALGGDLAGPSHRQAGSTLPVTHAVPLGGVANAPRVPQNLASTLAAAQRAINLERV